MGSLEEDEWVEALENVAFAEDFEVSASEVPGPVQEEDEDAEEAHGTEEGADGRVGQSKTHSSEDDGDGVAPPRPQSPPTDHGRQGDELADGDDMLGVSVLSRSH